MDNHPIKSETKPTMMQMILGKSSKAEMVRTFGKMDLYQVASGNYTSLAELAKVHSAEKIENVAAVLVADLNSTFEGDLKTDQMKEIAMEIMSGITCNMPLELLFVCLQEMKYDDIGFGKLTINKVLRAARKKFNEYQQIRMQQRRSDHFRLKQQPIEVHPRITDLWKEVLESIPNERESNRIAREMYLNGELDVEDKLLEK